MKGIIIRIAVKNFVTYKSVEFRPGRNLNLIIGPNGTGKSTIVCAIVLGLGGKPKTVGRGSNVGSYVREGCSEGSVEIELFNPGGPNYVIVRHIVRASNKTTWNLNGHPASQKQVDEVITKLNIQVDNLCQFLPQDRVQDFAKMDQKSLLENTEKTVGAANMYDQHMTLKELRSKQIGIEKNINQITAQLETEQQRNDRIAVEATNVSQKKTLMEEIYQLKQKRAWLKYDEMKANVEEMKQDTILAHRSMTKHKKKCEPLQQQILEAKKKIKDVQDAFNRSNAEDSRIYAVLKDKLEQIERMAEVWNENERDYREQVQQELRRQDDYRKIQLVVDNYRNNLSQLDPTLDQSIKDEIKTVLTPELSKHVDQMRKYEQKKVTINESLEGLMHEIHAAESERNKANNVLVQRLDILRRKQYDVYQAVMWLRENRHQFKGKVYDPMMLEMNVVDVKLARVVESYIPLRDLLAFTCEEKEDMEKLLKILRGEQKLKINVLHSGTSHQASELYQPRDPIPNIACYGFFTYIRELITAPEPILKYLCRNSHIHSIPVGDATTFTKASDVPPHIRCFFSDNHSFNVSISRYTQSKSTRSTELMPGAFYLANSINMDFLQAAQLNLDRLYKIRQEKDATISSLTEYIKKEETAIDLIRRRKKELGEKLDQQRAIQARLNSKLTAMKSIERDKIDLDQLEEKYRNENKQALLEISNFQEEILKAIKDLYNCSTERTSLQEEVSRVKNQAVKMQTDAEEMTKQLRAAEAMYQSLYNRLNVSKQELKHFFTIAKELTDAVCPSDEEFKVFELAFQSLPPNIDEIEKEIESRQVKVDCIGNANDGLLLEYEQRKKTIDDLAVRIESQQLDADEVQTQIEQIKAEWLPPLKELIQKINVRFGLSFEKIRCVGQVSLSVGENENDFQHYGLSIKVKFRDGEPLKQLNQHIQSGGERAVSTAIYMISLQELTNVPFRCVDEINQGMDPVNERMVFDLLVKTTSQKDTAQYFLLTPKLLPSLTYEKTMNVMCVYNGPHCLPHSRWDLGKFKKIKLSVQESESE